MFEYALFINDEFKEIRRYDEKPEDIPHKGVTWHDVVRLTEYGTTGLEDGVWVIRQIDPATRPPVVPRAITPRQARLLLLQRGMLSDVTNLISQQDEATRIIWEYALEFQRDDPLLNTLAKNLGLEDSDIDQFFIDAYAI